MNKTKNKIEIKEDALTGRTLVSYGNGGVVEVSQGSEVRRVAFLVLFSLNGRRRTHSDALSPQSRLSCEVASALVMATMSWLKKFSTGESQKF